MTKPIIAVSIYVQGIETAITVSDATVAGVGGAVVAALDAGQDLHFNNGTTEYFIPFHAVAYATITRTTQTVDDPVDDLCVTEETPGNGGSEEETPGHGGSGGV